MANNRRLNKFEIFGLFLFEIVISLIVFVGPLSTSAAESKTLLHHGKSAAVDGLSSTQTGESSGNNIDTDIGSRSSSTNDKVIMIDFDDSFKTQVLYAKPILDKYGFKTTFFEVCGWIGKSSERKSWQDITALRQDGMNIESHTMTHPHLNTLSPIELNSEIGGAKQCFIDHGIKPTIFAYPYSEGWKCLFAFLL